MNKRPNNNTKITKPSYVYSIVSITLVLFLLGLLGVIMLQANALSKHIKENLEVLLALNDQVTQQQIVDLQQKIGNQPYTKSVFYTSKEEAAKQFIDESNEDFTAVLGYNPLFASLNLYVKAAYANSDSLQLIKQQLLEEKYVSNVFYQENVVNLINTNAKKIGFVILALSLIFLLIAFTLIDNTIKLAMYSNRFLIKSMQLVGATRWFIAQPFITQSVYNGVISGLLSCVLLALVLLIAQSNIPELSLLNQIFSFLVLCVVIVFTGIFISWWSTKRSVVKYLQVSLDELY